ncbi:hypothetical protein [Mesobacterium pallidum]|nr:hypothetical protein [Mesobacterium pallidum]
MYIVKVGFDSRFPDAFLLLTLYESSAPAIPVMPTNASWDP